MSSPHVWIYAKRCVCISARQQYAVGMAWRLILFRHNGGTTFTCDDSVARHFAAGRSRVTERSGRFHNVDWVRRAARPCRPVPPGKFATVHNGGDSQPFRWSSVAAVIGFLTLNKINLRSPKELRISVISFSCRFRKRFEIVVRIKNDTWCFEFDFVRTCLWSLPHITFVELQVSAKHCCDGLRIVGVRLRIQTNACKAK